MARLAAFDKLNTLEKQNSDRNVIPIERFFQEMELPEASRESRITLAYLLLPVFTYLFYVAGTMADEGEIDYYYLYSLAQRRYEDALREFEEKRVDTNPLMASRLMDAPKVKDRIVNITQEIVNTTMDNIENSYYTSDDRATFIAENETNALINYDEILEAIEEGFTMKRWVTMNDNRVRMDHSDVDGQEIPIGEYFLVGNEQMLYPCDMDASPEQTVNCRCSIEYF